MGFTLYGNLRIDQQSHKAGHSHRDPFTQPTISFQDYSSCNSARGLMSDCFDPNEWYMKNSAGWNPRLSCHEPECLACKFPLKYLFNFNCWHY
jgi:hypothetical protein